MNLNDILIVKQQLEDSKVRCPYTQEEFEALQEGINLLGQLETDTVTRDEFNKEFEDWYVNASKSKRNAHNKRSRELGFSPILTFLVKKYSVKFISFKFNKESHDIPAWGFNMSKEARSRVRKQSNKLGISPEEYIKIRNERPNNNNVVLNTNSNKSHTKALKKAERVEMKQKLNDYANDINKLAQIDKTNISITTWDSAEMQAEIKERPSLKTSKGMVFGLMNGSETIRQKTFYSNSGSLMELSDIRQKVLNLITDEKMLPIEEKFSSKVGDFASLPFIDWADKVVGLWRNVNFTPKEELLEKAIGKIEHDLIQLFKLSDLEFEVSGILKPLTIEDAYLRVRKGRNSGYPFFTSKWSSNEDMISYYKQEANIILNESHDFDTETPRILLKRAQNNGENVKMRPVECPPKSEAIAAKAFTDKFIGAFKQSRQFCGFHGGNNIDNVCVDFLKSYDNLISSDFSEFDTRACNFIPIIFKMVDKLSAYKYTNYFEVITEYYTKSRLITPLGIIEGRDGIINGLNSGDGWTSVIGTLTNAIANEYSRLRFEEVTNQKINWDVLSYGDDCVIGTDNEFNAELYSQFMSELGMLCNPEKQEITEGEDGYFSFLGYYYFKSDLGKKEIGTFHTYPIMRSLSKLIFLEKEMRVEELTEEMVAQQQITSEQEKEILMDALKNGNSGLTMLSNLQRLENCRNHHNFSDFIKFFSDHEPNMMDPTLILPYAKLKNSLRNQRVTRGNGVFESNGFQWLINYHCTINDIKADKQEVLSLITNSFGIGGRYNLMQLVYGLMKSDIISDETWTHYLQVLTAREHQMEQILASIKDKANLTSHISVDDKAPSGQENKTCATSSNYHKPTTIDISEESETVLISENAYHKPVFIDIKVDEIKTSKNLSPTNIVALRDSNYHEPTVINIDFEDECNSNLKQESKEIKQFRKRLEKDAYKLNLTTSSKQFELLVQMFALGLIEVVDESLLNDF